MTVPVLSPDCAPTGVPLLGNTQARIFTPSLVELTPETSYGFAVVEFARDVLGEPLDPWQQWLVIRLGELLPDGRPRFRYALVIVARQNGKTHLLKVLALFWLFVEQWPMVLGTSSNLEYARESWSHAVELAEGTEGLRSLVASVKRGNNDVRMTSVDGCAYKIAAANRRGGRSLSVDRLILDELREHSSFAAWNASTKAMNARPHAQAVAITNQGDDTSVVLDSLRDSALAFIETGEGDRRLGLFEWSAPADCDPLDPAAHRMANPNYGHRIDPDTIAGDAARAVRAGGEELAGFRTEVLCIRVRSLATAVDPDAWARGNVPGDLSGVRDRLAAMVDVSPDARHVTLVAAAVLPDGRARVEAVSAWDGPDAVDKARRDLPGWLGRVRPRVVGWLPAGPGAALAADMAPGRLGGVPVVDLRSEVAAVCMGFAEQVAAGKVLHAGDPLLNAHVLGAGKLVSGDTWRFSRKGGGHCDAAYAAAGAVHLARTLPAPVGKPRIVVGSLRG